LLPRLAAPEATATIGARTEHLRVRRAAGGAGIGRVRWIEHLGDANHLHLRVADGGDEHDLVILTDPGAGLVVGDAVEVDFVAPLFFGADGRRIEA